MIHLGDFYILINMCKFPSCEKNDLILYTGWHKSYLILEFLKLLNLFVDTYNDLLFFMLNFFH